MTEAEFVKIAGRQPNDLERRVNGIHASAVTACNCTGSPKSILDEAGQPMLVEGIAVCPVCGRNPFGVEMHAGLVLPKPGEGAVIIANGPDAVIDDVLLEFERERISSLTRR